MMQGEFWIETFTGKRFDILDPKPEMVCFEDIAHALSNTCRYGGHCDPFYSVAEHSVLMAAYVYGVTGIRDLGWLALMHDAAEAYTGDFPSPFKWAIPQLKEIEQRIEAAVFAHFGIDKDMPGSDLVKHTDKRICVDERARLMTTSGHRWATTGLESIGAEIRGELPVKARRDFIAMGDFLK